MTPSRGYPDDGTPRWNPGERGYGEQQDYGRGGTPGRYDEPPRYDSGGYGESPYGVPPQRGRTSGVPPAYSPDVSGDLSSRTGGGRTGAPLFTSEEAARFQQSVAPVSSPVLVPPTGQAPRRGTGASHAAQVVVEPPKASVYRARKPAVAGGIAIAAVAFGMLMVRALAVSAFGDTFMIGGVIASSLVLAGLPLLGLGLYGLVTGATHGIEQDGFRVWGKAPLAYLPIGLVLLLAGGIAAPLTG